MTFKTVVIEIITKHYVSDLVHQDLFAITSYFYMLFLKLQQIPRNSQKPWKMCPSSRQVWGYMY